MLVQRKRIGILHHALRLLYKHFNRCFRKDVLLFHNGDFDDTDKAQFRSLYGPEIQLHLLEAGSKYWSVPQGLNSSSLPSWEGGDNPLWPLGYRHMCRWNGVLMFEYLERLGYQWILRMDDDSLLLSCMKADPFVFLEERNYSYGYRCDAAEYAQAARGLLELAVQHMLDAGIAPHGRVALAEHARGGVWDRWIIYNNLMLTRLSFWTSPAVQQWLQRVDESGIVYRNRIGDAPLQTMTLLMFTEEPQQAVHHFRDWSYAHGIRIAVPLHSLLPAALGRLVPRSLDLQGGVWDFNNVRHVVDLSCLQSHLPWLLPWLREAASS